ncbi:MAG: 50S ribosomal protein L13 [Candidatus ainarchaeum sp.]|nr:50S ribosomal protein L13 [Candidatus ainarchaeum sp.]MDD3975778.1 50S ribosomal protein L13 [Candidatus ainarchaeum sp.]
MILINAENKIYGRLASDVAKKLLSTDDKIVVVNSGLIIVSGDGTLLLKKISDKRERGGKGNPLHNPKQPRYPDLLFKRSVRGMLPRSPKGLNALKRLTVYIDVPEEFSKNLEKAVDKKNIEHTTLNALCKKLGAKLKL